MAEIAPGYILQRMYLKKRLKRLLREKRDVYFYEVGAGNGNLSRVLLEAGLSGRAYDLNESACENNRAQNAPYIDAGTFSVESGDFFDARPERKADLILSSMVIEHLPPEKVDTYFERCKELLQPGGVIITFVPASMNYWGIEDEIAGHFKRYEFDCFRQIAQKHHLKLRDLAGLTFPLSNLLFPLSNRIVSKNEAHKKELTLQEQTVLSGNRGVKYKTEYPVYFRLLLNEVTMLPFYALQSMFRNHSASMVLYCELEKADA